MPFAPVTIIEHIKENYIGITDDPLAAKYMTATYDCAEKMKKKRPPASIWTEPPAPKSSEGKIILIIMIL